MKRESQLAAAADENFVASFRKLAEHCPEGEIREIGGVFAFVTGLQLSLFNGCVVTGPATPAELEAVLEWMSMQSLPHRAWIAQGFVPELGDLPVLYGLHPEPLPYPGMVLHPVPELPAPSAGVMVEPVAEANLEEYLQVCVKGGLDLKVAQWLFSRSFASDPDVQLFVGRIEGRPVGTSVAIRSGGACGVYNVGTLPHARRRGVGAALTWAAVAAGEGWGCDTVVLQSSAMALSLYSAMGFRTVASYTVFSQPQSIRDGSVDDSG